MKSNDIRRSVQSSRSDRVAGDAPSIGRVARMRGTGLPRPGRRRKKRGEGSRNKSEPKYRKRLVQVWSLIVCGLAVTTLGIVIFLWLVPKMESGGSGAGQVSSGTRHQVRVVSQFASPSESEALALVKQALSIREPERVGEFFRVAAASPQEVVDFLTKMESVDGVIERYMWTSSMDANGLSIDGVLVSSKGAERPLSRLALFTPDAVGQWKVDFEAFARVVTPSWNEILSKGTALAQVRVYVAKDSYYNGAFKDDKQWVCHRMTSPDTEEVLFGYSKVGSLQAAAINWMFSKEEKGPRATLEIRRVEGAESRQFEILRVIAEDWVVSDVPFEKGFSDFK